MREVSEEVIEAWLRALHRAAGGGGWVVRRKQASKQHACNTDKERRERESRAKLTGAIHLLRRPRTGHGHQDTSTVQAFSTASRRNVCHTASRMGSRGEIAFSQMR